MKKLISVFLAVMLVFTFGVVAFAADGGVISGFFETLNSVKDFIYNLFVPSENYFHNQLSDLSAKVNDRFGGLAYLYHMLDEFFTELKNPTTSKLMFTTPNNYLYRGYKGMSLDVLSSAKPYISFLRSTLTAVCYLFTAIVCYKKLLTFFNH